LEKVSLISSVVSNASFKGENLSSIYIPFSQVRIRRQTPFLDSDQLKNIDNSQIPAFSGDDTFLLQRSIYFLSAPGPEPRQLKLRAGVWRLIRI